MSSQLSIENVIDVILGTAMKIRTIMDTIRLFTKLEARLIFENRYQNAAKNPIHTNGKQHATIILAYYGCRPILLSLIKQS